LRILLHCCCGPCSTFPLKTLNEEGHSIFGFFYNPNIHPFQEYQKRLDTFQEFAAKTHLQTIIKDNYDLDKFLREIAFREEIRCRFCYYLRLTETAKHAKKGKFDGFSTTLLVSPFQKHSLIKQIGEEIGEMYQIQFLYRDFRMGFKEGVEISKEMQLYRQTYCGCIYSERDRYRKE
jgi:predicted adenine nucleotide alpha hydrolase (AANH) superfamily ATPase